MTPLDGPAIYD